MANEKKMSVVQVFEGMTLVSKLEDVLTDPEKGPRFAAIALADDETIKKSRKDPSALLPYILQVEAMAPEEVASVIRNFSEKLKDFSMSLLPVVLPRPSATTSKSAKNPSI